MFQKMETVNCSYLPALLLLLTKKPSAVASDLLLLGEGLGIKVIKVYKEMDLKILCELTVLS